jgi:hypothetical protein
MEDRDLVNDLMSAAVQAEKKLSTELGDYVGKWVAVRDHEIVADADTLAALLDKIDPDSVEAVFQVVEQGTASFF